MTLVGPFGREWTRLSKILNLLGVSGGINTQDRSREQTQSRWRPITTISAIPPPTEKIRPLPAMCVIAPKSRNPKRDTLGRQNYKGTNAFGERYGPS